ncbi:MAG: right-handed parallel beta-helix repeat-containing protein, partial [Planctomycetia bacterium]|nr:right-handed parallel beta-helix repeat-containing protein [Planctomycetia bacterium]
WAPSTGTVSVKKSEFNRNAHGFYAYNWQDAALLNQTTAFEDCQFNDNSGWHGLLSYFGPVTIKSSTFNGNKGDGIYTVYNTVCAAQGIEASRNGRWGIVYHVNHADKTNFPYLQNNVQSVAGGVIDGNGSGLFVYNARQASLGLQDAVISNNKDNGLYLQNSERVLDDQQSKHWAIRNNGIGLNLYATDARLSNVLLEGCTQYGIQSVYGKCIAENCTVTGTGFVGFYGYLTPTVALTSCRFDGAPRSSDQWGWASLTYGCSPDVRNCIFNGYPHGAYPYTYGNEAITPQPRFVNCTFANLDFWGFHLPNGQAEVRNCIFAGKAGNADGYGMARGGGNLVHGNNLMHGFAGAYYNTTGTEDDVLKNPRFADLSNGDLHLGKGSPAINAGMDTSAIVPYDMEGNARPSFKVVEIGAYEYTNPAGAFRVVDWKENK